MAQALQHILFERNYAHENIFSQHIYKMVRTSGHLWAFKRNLCTHMAITGWLPPFICLAVCQYVCLSGGELSSAPHGRYRLVTRHRPIEMFGWLAVCSSVNPSVSLPVCLPVLMTGGGKLHLQACHLSQFCCHAR